MKIYEFEELILFAAVVIGGWNALRSVQDWCWRDWGEDGSGWGQRLRGGARSWSWEWEVRLGWVSVIILNLLNWKLQMWVSCRDWGEIEIQSEIEFEGWHYHLLASRFEPPAGWSQIVSLKPWVSSLKSQARSLKCKAQGSSSSLKAPSQSPSRAELQPGSAHQPSQRPGLSFSVRPQSSPEALFFRISKFRKWEGAFGYEKTFELFCTN